MPEGNFFCADCNKYGSRPIPERFFNFTFVRDIKQETADTLWASDAEDYSSSDEEAEEIDIDEPDQPIPEEPSDETGDEEEPYEFDDEEEREWVPDSRSQKPNPYGQVPGMGMYGQPSYANPNQFPQQFPTQSPYYPSVPQSNFTSPVPYGSFNPSSLSQQSLAQPLASSNTYPTYPSSQMSTNAPFSPMAQQKPNQYTPTNQMNTLPGQVSSPYLQAPMHGETSTLLSHPVGAQSSLLSSPSLSMPSLAQGYGMQFPNQGVGLNTNGPNAPNGMDSGDDESSDISDDDEPLSPKEQSNAYFQQQQQILQQHPQASLQQSSLLGPLQSQVGQSAMMLQSPGSQAGFLGSQPGLPRNFSPANPRQDFLNQGKPFMPVKQSM